MIYITSILFTLAFVLYQKFQLQDLKSTRNVVWKTWAVVMKAIFFAAVWVAQQNHSAWQDFLLAGAICILVFEIGINVIALKQGVFYVGKSSKTDSLGKWKWIGFFIILAATIFIKLKF